MPLVWDGSLCVGHKGIDDDHEKLVSLFNRFEDAVQRNQARSIIAETVCALADYAMSHFTREEHVMLRVRYPGYEEHKALHDGFLEELSALAGAVEERADEISGELLDFFKVWIVDHLMTADQDLSNYLCDTQAEAAIA